MNPVNPIASPRPFPPALSLPQPPPQPPPRAADPATNNDPLRRAGGRPTGSRARSAPAPGRWLGLSLLGLSPDAGAAEAVAASGQGWNLVIALLVVVFTLASAALPLAACRQWQGAWRGAAIFPLAALGLWIVIIVLGKMASELAHPLWPFEIFAWAMFNMIYMVIALTAKRTLDKADREGGPPG